VVVDKAHRKNHNWVSHYNKDAGNFELRTQVLLVNIFLFFSGIWTQVPSLSRSMGVESCFYNVPTGSTGYCSVCEPVFVQNSCSASTGIRHQTSQLIVNSTDHKTIKLWTIVLTKWRLKVTVAMRRTQVGVELRVVHLHQLLDLVQLLLHTALVHLKIMTLQPKKR
jgi:hypothetical protein